MLFPPEAFFAANAALRLLTCSKKSFTINVSFFGSSFLAGDCSFPFGIGAGEAEAEAELAAAGTTAGLCSFTAGEADAELDADPLAAGDTTGMLLALE